jgi:hypothetical protein
MDDLLQRLAKFERSSFPRFERVYKQLVSEGQHPSTLFIGCSDSRIVPSLLMDCGPGELFRFVPHEQLSHRVATADAASAAMDAQAWSDVGGSSERT